MNGFTDKPTSTLNEDAFGVQQYITGLNDFIMECYTPMTIAIQGDWGNGKTTTEGKKQETICSNCCCFVLLNCIIVTDIFCRYSLQHGLIHGNTLSSIWVMLLQFLFSLA